MDEQLKRKAEEDINQASGKKADVESVEKIIKEVAVKVEVLPATTETTEVSEVVVEAAPTAEVKDVVMETAEVKPVVAAAQGMDELIYSMKLDGLSQKITKKVITNHGLFLF
jgi:uncharacterized protein YPO0396